MSMLNIRREAAGWVVRIMRNGEESSRYFRFTNGGVRKSLADAKSWRDKQLKLLGARQWRKGPRNRATNNTSGVTGVSKNKFGRWVATWHENGKQWFRTFDKKREAVAFRKEQVERLSQALSRSK